MAFDLKSNIDPVRVPIRPLKGMITDAASTALKPGNFIDLSNYWVTKKGIRKRNGFSSFANNTALPVEDQPIISIAPVWKTDGNQFAAVLTSRYLYTLTGFSFSAPVYWVYDVGECSVSGTTVTGYGTDWNKETNYILPGDTIIFGNDEQIGDGDCESAVGPDLNGDIWDFVGPGGYWERSSETQHGDTYSWRLRRGAAGSQASVQFSSGGMHGLIAGNTYECRLWMYTDAANLENAYLLFEEFYDGSWHNTFKQTLSQQNVWEEFTQTITLNPSTLIINMTWLIENESEDIVLHIDDISITTPGIPITSVTDHNTLTISVTLNVGAVYDPVVDHIENGDCESASSPTLDGGTSGLAGGTWARSAVKQKGGLYSWLLTKTAAATVNPAVVYLTDNTNTTDMHGLVAGTTYTFSLWMWTDVVTAASATIKFQEYYSGSWNDTITITPDNLSSWDSHSAGPIFETVTLNGSTTGVTIEVRLDTAEAAGVLLYVDDIAFVENGLSYEIRRAFNVDDTDLLDWTVTDGKLLIADHTRPLYAYDGADLSLYSSTLTYIASCVTFFAERVWIGNIIENGVYYFQRIRWSSPTDRTSFGAADYVDLPYTASPIRRLVPLGRYLIVYFDNTVFIGAASTIVNLPFVFRQMETGGRGLLGVRAVTTAEGGHFFAARDDIYYLTPQGTKPLSCPVTEEMIDKCGDPRRVYIVNDHKNSRVVFGFPTTGRYIERLWSFHYRTGQWSYDDISATSIANPALDLGLTWDDLSLFLSVDTWDEGMTTFTSWDSIGSAISSNVFYRMESGIVQQLSDDSGTDVDGNFTTVWTTGDLDLNRPDEDKTFTRLYMKLQKRPLEEVRFSIACSYDGGYTWNQIGQLSIANDKREAKIDFLITGSSIRFRAVETSSVHGYEIIEIGLTVRGRGAEVEFD